MTSKMDIGVHKDLDIEQEEYCFDVCFQEDSASVLINSRAQMLTEKLKYIMRFGTRSTRYKDIFDICYLSEQVDMSYLIPKNENILIVGNIRCIIKRKGGDCFENNRKKPLSR